MVSETFSMPTGQPLSSEFQISNLLAKLYININQTKKSEQSLHQSVRNSPDNIWRFWARPFASSRVQGPELQCFLKVKEDLS